MGPFTGQVVIVRKLRRRIFAAILAVVALLVAFVAWPGSGVLYLAQQAYFQLELLYGRVPNEVAAQSGVFTEAQLARLDQVDEIKAYGQRIGLSATENYETINPTFHRTIWNVSACEPLRFRPETWWFPIVGRVPYLGFFREQDARAREQQLRSKGLDVHRRTAGAYSTLGWFRDPLLPKMLDWSEAALSETLLHELAHATLWVPGSVKFNESFANFVGEQAADGYLLDKYGPSSEPLRKFRDGKADSDTFRVLMHSVYEELNTVFKDRSLSRWERAQRKQAILASLGRRVAAAGFARPERYRREVRPGTWNNARLIQFKAYNTDQDRFQVLLDQEGGDLLLFIDHVRRITADADDPYAALRQAAPLPDDDSGDTEEDDD